MVTNGEENGGGIWTWMTAPIAGYYPEEPALPADPVVSPPIVFPEIRPLENGDPLVLAITQTALEAEQRVLFDYEPGQVFTSEQRQTVRRRGMKPLHLIIIAVVLYYVFMK